MLIPRILYFTASVKSVASDMTDDMMSFYKGNQPGQTPGLLPQPYYCKPEAPSSAYACFP